MLTTDRIEIIPVPGIVEQVRRHLPAGSGVSVTALPSHAISDTVATALALADAGFDPIPHLASARIDGHRQLDAIVSRLSDSPMTELFVIGGDGPVADGAFPDGAALLSALRDKAGDRFRLGVAAYPEGHPAFGVGAGLEILRAKAAEADHAVTQMCFDGAVVGAFVRQVAAEGIRLPLWLGVPGQVSTTQLLKISARIGVGPSLAFARKGSNRRLLARYDSVALRRAVLAGLGESASSVAGFHVFSFNALDRLDSRGDARARAGSGGSPQ